VHRRAPERTPTSTTLWRASPSAAAAFKRRKGWLRASPNERDKDAETLFYWLQLKNLVLFELRDLLPDPSPVRSALPALDETLMSPGKREFFEGVEADLQRLNDTGWGALPRHIALCRGRLSDVFDLSP